MLKIEEGGRQQKIHTECALNYLGMKLNELEDKRIEMLKKYGKDQKLVKQLIDLALLANNQLKGEALAAFVKRSVDLIK